jgi:tRNA pseudouridine55 synthase
MNAPRARVARRPVHGVLLLDKPLGWSSNDALQKVKWLLRAEKAGHTGTLDPLATGVLPICFGAATKFSQLQLEADKEYEARLCLGVKTATGDAEGEILCHRAVEVSIQQVEAIATRFVGPMAQLPPMYSALKKQGKALYEYARAGIEVERCAREITVHSLRIEECALSNASPSIRIVVACSKGTYIRTLGEDIGEFLGCGAHLGGLRRRKTGNFKLDDCISLEALEGMAEVDRVARVLPVETLLDGHEVVHLDQRDAARFLNGLRRTGIWPDSPKVAVHAKETGALLGTACIKVGELIPTRLLNPLEVSQAQARSQNPEIEVRK